MAQSGQVEGYHKDFSRVSKTMLGHFLTSREDYFRYYISQTDEPPAPTKQMQIGTAVHAALLENVPLDDICVEYTDDCFKSNGHLNPHQASKFRAKHTGAVCMKSDEIEQVRSCIEAARSHSLNILLTHPEAKFEQVIKWTCPDTGLDCRAMLDFYIDMGDRMVAYDLKTTEQIYPDQVARTSKRLRYWLQDAHYSAGLKALFGKPVDFKFWFIEVKHPFRISPKEYTPQAKEVARSAYLKTMFALRGCELSGVWRDEWTHSVTPLSIGPWDVDAEEEELTGFDEEASDE